MSYAIVLLSTGYKMHPFFRQFNNKSKHNIRPSIPQASTSMSTDIIVEVLDSQEDDLEIKQKTSREGTLIPESQENQSINMEQNQESSSDTTFQPSSDQLKSSYIPDKSDKDAERIEFTRRRLQMDPTEALNCLSRYEGTSDGWCSVVKLTPSKNDGYAQLSYMGANKFAVLQEVVLWAKGDVIPVSLRGEPRKQASHLCKNKLCKTLSHITMEDEILNQRRKGCRVWRDCPHGESDNCRLKLFLCTHEPCCVKFAEGYMDEEDFMANGVHILPDDDG
jgi:hypothetical protein